MGTITLTIPQAGVDLNSVADPEISSDLTTIQAVIDGGLDSSNIAASLGQSAGVNVSGQTVKGAVNIATSQSTSSTSYTTLATPDQVTGIVLPTNGLIRVWYWATWQESVQAAARAAIFVGSNQLKILVEGGSGPTVQETGTSGTAGPNTNVPLYSTVTGLTTNNGWAYSGDVTTGQILGIGGDHLGGPCDIFAAAGTYTVSVQFKASSGSVTASNRKLWVQALSFS